MPSYVANIPSNVALSAATAKTVLAVIAPSTRRLRLRELFIGFQSVTASDAPVLVELVQFDTDGTGTAVTLAPDDTGDASALATAKHTYTVEPSTNAVVRKHWLVPAQAGYLQQELRGDEVVVPASKVLALRCTAPQAQSARGYLEFSE